MPSPARTQRRPDPRSTMATASVSGACLPSRTCRGTNMRDDLVDAVDGELRVEIGSQAEGSGEVPAMDHRLLSLPARPEADVMRTGKRPAGASRIGHRQGLDERLGAVGKPRRQVVVGGRCRHIPDLAGPHDLGHPAMHAAEMPDQVAHLPRRARGHWRGKVGADKDGAHPTGFLAHCLDEVEVRQGAHGEQGRSGGHQRLCNGALPGSAQRAVVQSIVASDRGQQSSVRKRNSFDVLLENSDVGGVPPLTIPSLLAESSSAYRRWTAGRGWRALPERSPTSPIGGR